MRFLAEIANLKKNHLFTFLDFLQVCHAGIQAGEDTWGLPVGLHLHKEVEIMVKTKAYKIKL